MNSHRRRAWSVARATLVVRALLLGLATLWPVSMAAAIASTDGSHLDAPSLPALPSALEELERREQQRAACGVFCGPRLAATLEVGVGWRGRENGTQDAWGNYRFPAELQASRNRYGFTGHLWDAETNLYYAKARYFDPNFGRFLTQDSYLGQTDDPPSLHRYFYANANPTRYVDPSGHESLTEAAAREAARRGGLAAQGPTYTNMGAGRGDRQTLNGDPGYELRASGDRLVADEAQRHRREGRGEIVITEDDAGGGHPTEQAERKASDNRASSDPDSQIERIQADKDKALRTAAEIGRRAQQASELGISVLWSPADNVLVLATGKDINGHEASRVWAALGIGTVVVVAVGGKVFKVVKNAERLEEDLQDAAKVERRVTKLEGEAAGASGVARRGASDAGSSALSGGLPYLPKSVGAAAGEIQITSKINGSSFAVRQAERLGQGAQRDVDKLLASLRSGNMNPGIGTRALGNNFFELRGANGGRVIVKQTSAGSFDIVGKFQGHVRGDAANSTIIQRLVSGYAR